MARPIRIALVTSDSARRQAWTATLQRCAQFCNSHDSPSDTTGPELVVTDRLPVDDQLPACGFQLLRGEIGIVSVGATGPADVALPADHSARELRLVCTLLAEIIRLRRRRGEDKQKHLALHELAFRDPLTGVGNRRMWETQSAERLEGLTVAGGDAVGRGLCLALFDLDNFKRVNDELGHVAGDEALRVFAVRLVHSVRQTDLVARLGGDEFVALLTHLEERSAESTVERIRVAAAVDVVGENGPMCHVTVSAGFVYLPPGCRLTGAAALQAADRQLALAKSGGRNRTCGGAWVA
jgi:diguanylate cyclase (GGDEF)-like protein